MEKKKIIAITGGIGSGKSLVLKTLQKLGYKAVSCDEEIAKLYNEEKIVNKIAKVFPSAFIDNKLNKKIISDIVFNDKKKLEELNNILHPIVMKRCFELAKDDLNRGVSFIEVPLLFESNLQDKFDNVIVVKRNLEDRINSSMKRSDLTRLEVQNRINNQFDYDNNYLSKYVVLENDGSISNIKEKILNLLSKIV